MATELTPPEADEEEEVSTGRQMDPELRTISAIIRLLREIDEDAKARVIQYVYARYARNIE
jgi:hypothetical protein